MNPMDPSAKVTKPLLFERNNLANKKQLEHVTTNTPQESGVVSIFGEFQEEMPLKMFQKIANFNQNRRGFSSRRSSLTSPT